MLLASLQEARTFAGIDDALSDDVVSLALAAATRRVQAHCGRTFDTTATVTTRTFDVGYTRQRFILPEGAEIATTTGLIVATDDNDDGTAETTWVAADYQLVPLGGYGPDGQPGWPYTTLTALSGWCPASTSGRGLLAITARWGWLAIPDPVKLATLFTNRELLPGSSVTLSDSGVPDEAAMLLSPFVRGRAVVGIG